MYILTYDPDQAPKSGIRPGECVVPHPHGVLVAAVAIIVYLPVGLNIIVSQSAKELTTRAQATPLLVGSKGSPLELVLNSLYFDTKVPARLEYSEVAGVRDTGLAGVIPLYVRFQSRRYPIVGTSLDYFEFRDLHIAAGSQMQRLGVSVVGWLMAEQPG